jgi:NADPH:quinone reductase-like Zn-dependent oxidoreductase
MEVYVKIIKFGALGEPADVLKLFNEPSAPLRAGEARVKVLATPIHPSNLLQIAGRYGTIPPLPSVPGSEGVGEVTEVAPDVTHLNVGQHVLLAGGSTWRDEIAGPAAGFIPLPAGGDVEQLSMLTVNPLTAHLILQNFVDLKPGDWIIQSAANSAVGEFIVQLAAQRGIRTVNVVRRESLAADLKALGANVVLVEGADLAARVSGATSGAPIVLAIDCVGGETFSHLLKTLAFGGTIVSYGALSMQSPALDQIAIIFNDVRVRGFWLSKWFETASAQDKQASFGKIIQLVASGALKAKVDSRFSLEDIKAAVTRAAEPGRNGKVLLMPQMAAEPVRKTSFLANLGFGRKD